MPDTLSTHLAEGVPTRLWLGGAWRDASDGARFDVFNPADETVLASVSSASVEDAAAALDAAEVAGRDWAARAPRERSEILRRAFELMTGRAEHFARLITLENGKARADAMGETLYAAEFFRWFAEEAVRADGLITRAPSSGARIIVQHKPAGIAVLVTPWNYPAAMGTRKIAPALAAGCPVIVKPASETPLTMLALMPLLEEAGVPPGVVGVLPSRRTGEVVDHMLHDPRVRVVSFTGSTAVGRRLLRSAADQVLKPAMELGGNAPADRVRGRRHGRGDRRRHAGQDAQPRRGLHRRQPPLRPRGRGRGVHRAAGGGDGRAEGRERSR